MGVTAAATMGDRWKRHAVSGLSSRSVFAEGHGHVPGILGHRFVPQSVTCKDWCIARFRDQGRLGSGLLFLKSGSIWFRNRWVVKGRAPKGTLEQN